MKIIKGFEFIRIDGRIMAVSTGDAVDVYKGIINLNETAYSIWKHIEAGLDIDQIASKLSEEYDDITVDEANKYAREFVDKLVERGILTES